MDGNNEQPIIIKKGKKKGEAGHGGAWKVAYADFVTAMMALFIVLWVLGQNDEVKEAVAGYFRDPYGVGVGAGPGGIEGGGKINIGPKSPEIIEEMSLKQAETKRFERMSEDIVEQLEESGEFENLKDQIEIQVSDEGLRIEIMESAKDVFFEVGTSDLNLQAAKLLKVIGKEVSNLNNKIVIEGHTDSRPYPGGDEGYNNFDLSADRANAARRVLVNGGIPSEQIDEIRGYADKRLRYPDKPFDAVNRRISIIVKYQNK